MILDWIREKWRLLNRRIEQYRAFYHTTKKKYMDRYEEWEKKRKKQK